MGDGPLDAVLFSLLVFIVLFRILSFCFFGQLGNRLKAVRACVDVGFSFFFFPFKKQFSLCGENQMTGCSTGDVLWKALSDRQCFECFSLIGCCCIVPSDWLIGIAGAV